MQSQLTDRDFDKDKISYLHIPGFIIYVYFDENNVPYDYDKPHNAKFQAQNYAQDKWWVKIVSYGEHRSVKNFIHDDLESLNDELDKNLVDFPESEFQHETKYKEITDHVIEINSICLSQG